MAKKRNEYHKQLHLIAATVFGIVTLAHTIRIAEGVPLILGNWQAPMSLSWFAIFIAGSLAALLWKSANRP